MDLEQLKASVSDPGLITQEVVDAKNRRDYKQFRAQHYPSIPDQMDMYYWDDVNSTTNARSIISSIKARFPKPIDGDDELLALIKYREPVRYDSKEAYELAMANEQK